MSNSKSIKIVEKDLKFEDIEIGALFKFTDNSHRPDCYYIKTDNERDFALCINDWVSYFTEKKSKVVLIECELVIKRGI